MAHKWLKWLITNQVAPANWNSEDRSMTVTVSWESPPKLTNLMRHQSPHKHLKRLTDKPDI
jgi:hypothetical protein